MSSLIPIEEKQLLSQYLVESVTTMINLNPGIDDQWVDATEKLPGFVQLIFTFLTTERYQMALDSGLGTELSIDYIGVRRLVNSSNQFSELRHAGKNSTYRTVVEAAYILLISKQSAIKPLLYSSLDELCGAYTYIKEMAFPEQELQLLLKFRNLMRIATLVIKAKNNKGHLLELVTFMTEGGGHRYITGTGQTLATTIRVQIYLQEGEVETQIKGPKRKKRIEITNSPIQPIKASRRGRPRKHPTPDQLPISSVYSDTESAERIDENSPDQTFISADCTEVYIAQLSSSVGPIVPPGSVNLGSQTWMDTLSPVVQYPEIDEASSESKIGESSYVPSIEDWGLSGAINSPSPADPPSPIFSLSDSYDEPVGWDTKVSQKATLDGGNSPSVVRQRADNIYSITDSDTNDSCSQWDLS